LFGRYRQMKPITLHSFGCFVTLWYLSLWLCNL
jgi:hypothetical protein